MSSREQAIEAAARAAYDDWRRADGPKSQRYDALNGTQREAVNETMRAAFAASLPILLNDLADRIANLPSHWVVDRAAVLVRAAAEGWGA